MKKTIAIFFLFVALIVGYNLKPYKIIESGLDKIIVSSSLSGVIPRYKDADWSAEAVLSPNNDPTVVQEDPQAVYDSWTVGGTSEEQSSASEGTNEVLRKFLREQRQKKARAHP